MSEPEQDRPMAERPIAKEHFWGEGVGLVKIGKSGISERGQFTRYDLADEILRLRAERDEAQLSHESSEATLAMTAARLGGTVERRPTERVNFLQRIDELVETEELFQSANEDRERFRAVSEQVSRELKQAAEEAVRYKALCGRLFARVSESDHEPGCEYGDFRIPSDDCDEILAGRMSMPPSPACTCGLDDLKADETAQRAAEEWAALVAFKSLFEEVSRALNCLPSMFPDQNGHVLDQARRIMEEHGEEAVGRLPAAREDGIREGKREAARLAAVMKREIFECKAPPDLWPAWHTGNPTQALAELARRLETESPPETAATIEQKLKANCPLETGLRPCGCDLPRCPVCNYTEHDARFEGDHHLCAGTIPAPAPAAEPPPVEAEPPVLDLLGALRKSRESLASPAAEPGEGETEGGQ